jgi:hypothetical protein
MRSVARNSAGRGAETLVCVVALFVVAGCGDAQHRVSHAPAARD